MASENCEELDVKGRDIKIRDEFEFADYMMQILLGYHLYANASYENFERLPLVEKISRLPLVIPLTWSWYRQYSREILVETVEKIFDFYHTRSSLIALVGMFEVTLRSFVERLENKGKIDKLKGKTYGARLRWAFGFVVPEKESLYDGPRDEERIKMIERMPDICLNVDEARRLRNVFMHNRGFFDKKYGTDAVKVPGRQPKMRQEFLREFLPACKQKILAHFSHEEFTDYMKQFLIEPEQDVPVLLKPEEHVEYSRSHIEFLHDLHDLVQRTCFDLKGSGYSYREEQERLKQKWAEWDRAFPGGRP